MAIPIEIVANHFIKISGGTLTHLQLQKLCYISQGIALANNTELFNERIEAWKYGPVIPKLYTKLKYYGRKPVDSLLGVLNPETGELEPLASLEDKDLEAMLDAVYNTYGKLSASKLSFLTHQDGTPWSEVYGRHGGDVKKGAVIPYSIMRRHYEELLERSEA